MQSPAAILYNNFQNSLVQAKAQGPLNYSTILEIAKRVFDAHFATMSTHVTTSLSVAHQQQQVSTAAPTQWSRLVTTKEYGLPAYFATETAQIKAANKGINHFTLVKALRDMFEPTPRWNDYLTWVRNKHPSGVMLKDPSPRKSETEKASIATTTTVVAVPSTPVPMSVPMSVIATPHLQLASGPSVPVTEEIVEDANDLGDL